MQNTNSNPLTYTITVTTASGVIIDQSPQASDKLSFTTESKYPLVVVQSVDFEHYNTESRGYFKLKFQIQSRGVYASQQLIIDLQMLQNANNLAKDTHCALYKEDGSGSFLWKSMQLLSFSLITIKPREDINDPDLVFIFGCKNIIVPSAYTEPSIKVISSDGRTVISA
jgi:hypothetical protein